MRAEMSGPGSFARGAVWLAVIAGCAAGRIAAADPAAELRAAAAAYAAAFNQADTAALADQWIERAVLVEGGLELRGRDAIVASLRAWRERHPGATLGVEVERIDLVAEPVARVTGTLSFTATPGGTPVTSRFTSLRVREGGVWRLAESIVAPAHSAALDELDWLLGTWTAETAATAADGAASVETVEYEKRLDGHCLVGRSRMQPATGAAVEATEIIHADRATGTIRSWLFDSTGAAGRGVIEFDGTSFEKRMVGTPSDRVPGRVARWTQIIAPTGPGRCTMHSIERSVDGVALPDGEPVHFRKVRQGP
jgi:uncharacterized protein (TIGR02246 family)